MRQALHWPSPISCIQDAFFSLVRRWLEQRGIVPSFWNVSWGPEAPRRDDEALRAAKWVFLFSSNEFVYHVPDVMNPLAVKSSNQRLAQRLCPVLAGKHVVVFSMDAHDTATLLRDTTLRDAKLSGFDFISEADFPISAQTARFAPLRQLPRPRERALDFAYWGTTKRRLPGCAPCGDARFDMLRDLFAAPGLKYALIGNHFGSIKAEARFDTNLQAIAPRLQQARATCCWQWPGHGKRLTARYIEALALGLVPFASRRAMVAGARRDRRAAWQRVSSSFVLLQRLKELRDPECFAARFAEAEAAYIEAAPSDESQGERLAELLERVDGRVAEGV